MSFLPAIHSPQVRGNGSHLRTGAERLKKKKPTVIVYTGIVKHWQESRGWIRNMDGRTHFIKKDALISAKIKALELEQEVKFSLKPDPTDPGGWVVTNLQVISS